MLAWKIGSATITSIVESETPTSPRFMYEGLSKEGAVALAQHHDWLGQFIDDNGYLLQKIQCFVVAVDDMVIAVDTCVGNDKDRTSDHWNQLDGPFLDDMTAAGYPPESVTHVICTHLHVDHVGWNTRLVDGEWVPTFPNADYLFVDAEYDHWEAERNGERAEDDPFDDDDVFGDSVAPITAAGQDRRVSADHVVSPSVRFESTPGHTPGHVSVVVESEGSRAIITGDMTHHPLQMADPDVSSKFDTDPGMARATRREVFPAWADGSTLVLGTHFGTPTGGLMAADGDGYRLDWEAASDFVVS